MEEQRVRISDIAEELGLSTATVSNVIHGKTKKISDETVKRVMELLDKRQYMPNMAGILMAQNPAKIIGVFVNDHPKYEGHTLEDFFISSSINHLSAEIDNSGHFMILKKTQNVDDIISFSAMWNMSGIVVIGFCEQDYTYLRNNMRIPFVVYDGFAATPGNFINITIDNFDGGYQMGAHFKELGHTKTLCISDNDICIDRERFEGFKEAFLPGNVSLLIIPMEKNARMHFYKEHLEQIKNVTAIFAVSDYYAIDMIRFLNEQEINVPRDISVAGFDDIPMCSLLHPTLTTIKQDGSLRAKLAIDNLLALKDNKDINTEIKLPVTLVARNSTKSCI